MGGTMDVLWMEHCPQCDSDDVDRHHHAATFALPECEHWYCNECGHEWGLDYRCKEIK